MQNLQDLLTTFWGLVFLLCYTYSWKYFILSKVRLQWHLFETVRSSWFFEEYFPWLWNGFPAYKGDHSFDIFTVQVWLLECEKLKFGKNVVISSPNCFPFVIFILNKKCIRCQYFVFNQLWGIKHIKNKPRLILKSSRPPFGKNYPKVGY